MHQATLTCACIGFVSGVERTTAREHGLPPLKTNESGFFSLTKWTISLQFYSREILLWTFYVWRINAWPSHEPSPIVSTEEAMDTKWSHLNCAAGIASSRATGQKISTESLTVTVNQCWYSSLPAWLCVYTGGTWGTSLPKGIFNFGLLKSLQTGVIPSALHTSQAVLK